MTRCEQTGNRLAIVLPDLGGGGVERVRLILAKEFLARGFEVDFVLMRSAGELLDEVPVGCRIVDLEAPRLRHAWLSLHRYLRRERPDVMLAAMWPLTGIACMAVRTTRVPVKLVVSEHTDFRYAAEIKSMERLILRRLGRWIYAPARAVATVSGGVAASLQHCAGLDAVKTSVIYNPIRSFELARALPIERSLAEWWGAGEACLLAVGSLNPAKAYDVLLKAVAHLRKNVDARLIILGDGPLRQQHEALVRDLGLEKFVRMPGFQSNPGPFYARADVFVLSSAWEGLPSVIMEALACGTPIVSTDCRSGPAEILEGGRFGTLVPVGDEQALCAAIRSALSRTHDREALKARAADFSPQVAAAKYLELLGLDAPGDSSRKPSGLQTA